MCIGLNNVMQPKKSKNHKIGISTQVHSDNNITSVVGFLPSSTDCCILIGFCNVIIGI